MCAPNFTIQEPVTRLVFGSDGNLNVRILSRILIFLYCKCPSLRPRKTWMEGVRAAMKTRHLEADQWLNRNGVWVPEDGDSCHKTGKIDR
jgi:hypothetical protein